MDPGTIRGNFDKMKSNYPTFKELRKDKNVGLYNLMVSLNKGEEDPGSWTQTSCCVQLSHALNMGGVIVPPSSYRRPNGRVGSYYYLQVPDEVEAYLSGRYGRAEDIRKVGDKKKMKDYIDGQQGVLVFRNGPYGAHVELWDETHILQDGNNSSGAGMDEDWCFGQPRILFYEVVEADDDDDTPPAWLQGWWEVYDGSTYYYYFNDEYMVTYTDQRPASFSNPPVRLPGNEGEVDVSSDELTVEIDWSPSGGEQTIEKFTRSATNNTFMNGLSNRYSPLTATKR